MYFEKQEKKYETKLSVSDTHMENEFIRVDFDKTTGEMCAFTDKTTGERLVGECSCVLMDETDSDTWSHDIKEFKKCYHSRWSNKDFK